MKELGNNGQKLILGKQGEDKAVVIRFEIESWYQEFGDGYLRARHKRRTDELPYPLELVEDGNYMLWVVSGTDNAVAGKGELELVYVAEDGTIAKSVTIDTYTYPSNVDVGDVPDTYEDWLVKLEILAHEATLSVMEFMEAHKDELRGETGFSGVHYGEDPPADDRVNVWIYPDGDPDVPVTQGSFDEFKAEAMGSIDGKIDEKIDGKIDEKIGSVIDGLY